MNNGLLERLLGRDRYYKFLSWKYDYGTLTVILGIVLVSMILVAVLLAPPSHVNDGYVQSEVLFTNNYTSGTRGFTFSVIVRLPEGDEVSVTTDRLAIASTVTKTACLERRKQEDGKHRYNLSVPAKCAAPE